MTKIAISPNVNGTGTFTLAAPDSNTDRTLTLPDAGGEVFSQGNIIGTVSESSGVPTGAIIERGSNANGEFVRFADGTMQCSGGVSRNINISGGFLGGFRSGGGDFTFNFPATFSIPPKLFANPNDISCFSVSIRDNNITETTGDVLVTAVTSQSGANRNIVFFATGRWY